MISSKWVHPEKTYPQNGCIQRKLFFKMGASRENFSSRWVHSRKTFAVKLMHPEKTLLQKGCIKSLSFMKFSKRMILFFKVSLHVIKVSLLMLFSLSLITSQSKLSLNKRRRSVKGSLSCFPFCRYLFTCNNVDEDEESENIPEWMTQAVASRFFL